MKLQIVIPKEFEVDFTTDKFEDFFSRLSTVDYTDSLVGKYEKETIGMFEKVFKNAKVIEEN